MIIEEVREIRNAHAATFNYDLKVIVAIKIPNLCYFCVR